MNILIVGATGFAGGWLTELLIKEEHIKICCAVRDPESLKQRFPRVQAFHGDLQIHTQKSYWLPHLANIDLIVNCAGVFYHPDKQILWDVHYHGPKALYEAAQSSQVKNIIHLSALGIDKYHNEYAASKKAIEDFLRTLPIPNVILRPSFIYGPHSGGGMEIVKKLASSPIVIPLPAQGKQLFQPIYVGDLVNAIKNLILKPPQTSTLTLAAVSSQQITLKEMIVCLRSWLGFKKAFFINIPFLFIQALAKLGDKISFSTFNTAAIQMLKHGNFCSVEEARLFQAYTDITPQNFHNGLHQHQALQEERWYHRLMIARPLLRVSLAMMWLFSSLTSILPYTKETSFNLLTKVGISSHGQPWALYGAALLNALIGLTLIFNYKTKLNCALQLTVIFIYTLIISIKLPHLWLEPFGPVFKNIPIVMSIVVLSILES